MNLPPLTEGRLLRRYQRFLADVQLADGSIVVAHCPNTGSMLGCKTPGSKVWLSASTNPKRKLAWTWELVEVDGIKIGIHTGRSNHLVKEALEANLLETFSPYTHIRTEVPYGKNSRIDLLLQGENLPDCYIEVKNVTLAQGTTAYFPDAITERGTKHLEEMTEMVRQGARAVLIFCVQRENITQVQPADTIDPQYGQTLRQALTNGVEAIALLANITLKSITLTHTLPITCL